jgi:uncharacterized protein YhfF
MMQALPSTAEVLATLHARGIALPPGPVRVDGYGDSPELSAALLALIVEGPKRATASLLWGFEAEGEAIPHAGQVEIVLDHLNQPVLITRFTQVQVVSYNQVTAEFAAIEGEGDGSLAYWQAEHWSYFSRECQRIGRVATEEMPVVCCVFELLGVIPAQSD